MKLSLSAITIITFLALLSCSTSKKKFGNYINTWRYWTPMIVLKEDSTFEFISIDNSGVKYDTSKNEYGGLTITTTNFQTCYDSTYGKYILNNDTVKFIYLTDALPGTNGCFSRRPQKMLWQGKNLYFVNASGAVLKQKDYYFKWTKGKAYTLYRN
jgi:hypothetical protein